MFLRSSVTTLNVPYIGCPEKRKNVPRLSPLGRFLNDFHVQSDHFEDYTVLERLCHDILLLQTIGRRRRDCDCEYEVRAARRSVFLA